MTWAQRIVLGIAIFAASVEGPGRSASAADDPSEKQETQLLETLRSAPPAEKAMACKELAIYGTKEAVPELAKLLADEQLASWARIALEAIPDSAADVALVEATKTLHGPLLVGTINSIGVRRSEAAVESLADGLSDNDAEVASAAAVALGRIANDAATKSLRDALLSAAPGVRPAVAEGCILCAERLTADGRTAEALEIYDAIRQADVPNQRRLEATRGAILARGIKGVPLLLEQLESPEKSSFQLGLTVARELEGQQVADAIAAELPTAPPDRAALLLYALADRPHAALSPAILAATRSGDPRVRLAAIEVTGRLGDAAQVPELLAIAADDDAELAGAAKAALTRLAGDGVDAAVLNRLDEADDAQLAILIDLIGRRRIEATPALVKALDHPAADIRSVALTALGETIGPQDLNVLIARAIADDKAATEPAGRALEAAAVRMVDREATAQALADAMARASAANKTRLLQILGAVGGEAALEAIAAAAHDGDDQLQDAATRVLGQWMTVDAGPVLLQLANDPAHEKYRIRALRGYIRLARQFARADGERADMCRQALDAATRPDERRLVLAVLEGYPSVEGLAVAVHAVQTPELKEAAVQTARAIAEELDDDDVDVQELIKQVGQAP